MIDNSESMHGQTGLQIIGAGFGRTGTLSIKAALEELGFGPCYHMAEVFQHPEHIAYWQTAAEGKAINWDAIFSNYHSAVDWPSCAFYQQQMRAYPDAKVLLTVRDPENWYESVSNTIYQIHHRAGVSLLSRLLSYPGKMLIKIVQPHMNRLFRMQTAVIWDGTFAGNFEDKAFAIAVFQRHIEEVKRTVPPEKLLVYNVKEGWEPLCAFLGVPVPEGRPFPRLNDREHFLGTRRIRQVERLSGAFLLSLLAGVSLTLLLFARRKRA
jgi:hypothetical protein